MTSTPSTARSARKAFWSLVRIRPSLVSSSTIGRPPFARPQPALPGLPQITATVHPDVFWEDASRAYLAPELVNDPTLHGEHVDVFSLGAIAYHIFSGQPPAGSSLELAEKLRRDRGLKLSAVLNGAGEELQMLVEHSTHPEVTVRLASVDEVLEQLVRVEEEFTTPSQEPVTNPADAKQDDRLQGGFLVKHRFGSGSAAIVFLVEKEAPRDGAQAGQQAREQRAHPRRI